MNNNSFVTAMNKISQPHRVSRRKELLIGVVITAGIFAIASGGLMLAMFLTK